MTFPLWPRLKQDRIRNPSPTLTLGTKLVALESSFPDAAFRAGPRNATRWRKTQDERTTRS